MAEERRIAPESLFNADTLVFVRLSVSQAGHRARAWGSVDGLDWVELGFYEFAEPLKYQGIAVSSHGAARGAKFLFGVPHNHPHPRFDHTRFIGKRDANDKPPRMLLTCQCSRSVCPDRASVGVVPRSERLGAMIHNHINRC